MRQVLLMRSNGVPNYAGATVYTDITGPLTNGGGGEFDVMAPWDVDGTFDNLVIRLKTAPGIGHSVTCTVRLDGVDTALTCTISGASLTARDTTHSFAVLRASLPRLSLKIVGTLGCAVVGADGLEVAIEFEGDTANESGWAWAGTQSNIGTNYASLMSGNYNGWTVSAGSTVESVLACAGTLESWTVLLHADSIDPGGEIYFDLYRNGILQDGTGGTVDARITFTNASPLRQAKTIALPNTPGDRYYVRRTNTALNTYATVAAIGGRFIASVDGQSNVCGYAFDEPATTGGGEYHRLVNDNPSAWGAYADHSITAGVTAFGLSKFYQRLQGAPTGTYTTSVAKNGALPSGTPSVVISGAEVADADLSGSVSFADGDTVGLCCVPLSTPTARASSWGLVMSVGANTPPVVSAGPDRTITWPVNFLSILGSASDDGLPNPPGVLTILWEQLSGDPAIIGPTDEAITTVEVPGPGTYVFKITGDDGEFTDDDTMTLTVAEPAPEIEFEPASAEIGLSWVETYHVDSANAPKVFLHAPVDLNDPVFYYGGFKEARVLSFGEVIRALSDPYGVYESAEFSWVSSDYDRLFRGWMANAYQKYIQNRHVIMRMIDDAHRRLFYTPRTLVRGVLRGYKPRGPLHYEFRGADFLTSLFGPANLQKQIPQEAISRAQFPTCPSASVGLPVPALFGELAQTMSASLPPIMTGDTARGFFSEGGYLLAGFGDLPSAAATPTGVSVTAGAPASGAIPTTLPGGAQWGAMVTAVDALGVESDPVPFWSDGPGAPSPGSFASGFPLPFDTVDGTQDITVAWTPSAGADKYRVYLGTYYYGFRPVVVKEASDPTATVTFTSDTDGTPASFYQSWTYSVSAVLADGETGISNEITSRVRTHRRPTRLEWSTVVGATAYRVRRKTPGSDWDRMWEVAAPTTSFDDDLLDTGATIINGIAELAGVVPGIPLGIVFDTFGNPWQEGLICGHQVEEISAVFQGGVQIDPALYGSTFLIPGQTGYSTYFTLAMGHDGSPQFHLVNDRVYTKFYVNGAAAEAFADGSKPITFNVKGRRNSDGDYIDQLADIYLEFITNFGFQDAGGNYLPIPVWDIDITGSSRPQIDVASFAALKALHAARLPGGYPGGIAFGADGTFITLRDALAQFNVSNDCDSAFNRNSQFFVTAFNENLALLETAREYGQVNDIVRDSVDVDPRADDVENVQIYSYRKFYALPADGRQWDIENAERKDDDAIDQLRERRPSRPVLLYGVRTALVAEDIVRRRLVARKEPPILVEIKTALNGLSTELGDVILAEHTDFPGSGLRPYRVFRHIVSPQHYYVRLLCEDVTRRYDELQYFGPLEDEAVMDGNLGDEDSTDAPLPGAYPLGDES